MKCVSKKDSILLIRLILKDLLTPQTYLLCRSIDLYQIIFFRFGPSLLRPSKLASLFDSISTNVCSNINISPREVIDPLEYTMEIPKINQIVQFLIEHVSSIFHSEGMNIILPCEIIKSTFQVKVIFSFTANNPSQLSINKEEIITVIKTSPSGWWKGINLNGQIGRFPANYCIAINILDKKMKK